MRGDRAEEITIHIGQAYIELELNDSTPISGRPRDEEPGKRVGPLFLSTKERSNTKGVRLAEDGQGRLLESQLRDAVVNLIVMGEERYRERQFEHHKWVLERRKERIEERRKMKAEAERKERERLAALEKARMDRLLEDANSLRLARDIRSYVDEVTVANRLLDTPVLMMT